MVSMNNNNSPSRWRAILDALIGLGFIIAGFWIGYLFYLDTQFATIQDVVLTVLATGLVFGFGVWYWRNTRQPSQ